MPDISRNQLKDGVWMGVALEISRLATCPRRRVGCVLLSSSGHVMSTGYNGPASGRPHCTDDPCPGSTYPSGQGLEFCEAVHAEINALIQCPDHQNIGTAYVTTFPCLSCIKSLLNSSCRRIVYLDDHPHTPPALKMWLGAGRLVDKLGEQ